jgi:hypothetical protein
MHGHVAGIALCFFATLRTATRVKLFLSHRHFPRAQLLYTLSTGRAQGGHHAARLFNRMKWRSGALAVDERPARCTICLFHIALSV